MKISRGDIFFVNASSAHGCEQHGNRPAVVVSNNACNRYSPVIQVVYLTTQRKNHLPTHISVLVESSGKLSTALCEQISPVDIARLGRKLGHLSADEIERLNTALAISIGLPFAVHTTAAMIA